MANFQVQRFVDHPIVSPRTHPSLGSNIQGPSVIRTPPWVSEPLGTYLLYFADHKGDHIRLAYADEIAGPWTVVEGGCLTLADSRFLTTVPQASDVEIAEIVALYDEVYDGYECVDVVGDITAPHIASPDVRVNNEEQRVEMWFHGLEGVGWQVTRFAHSTDGVHFSVSQSVHDGTYLRIFTIKEQDYCLEMPGRIRRRSGGPTEFEHGPTILPPTSRHMAAWVVGSELRVLFTIVGDAPERIMMVTVDTRPPWLEWKSDPPVGILRPERTWEGADLPLTPSIRSFWPEPANQLRDPYVFIDDDGQTYLFYAVAGESGIAVARLLEI